MRTTTGYPATFSVARSLSIFSAPLGSHRRRLTSAQPFDPRRSHRAFWLRQAFRSHALHTRTPNQIGAILHSICVESSPIRLPSPSSVSATERFESGGHGASTMAASFTVPSNDAGSSGTSGASGGFNRKRSEPPVSITTLSQYR